MIHPIQQTSDFSDDFFHYLGKKHPLSGELKTYLTSILQNTVFINNQNLKQAGHPLIDVYFIAKGAVRLFHKDGDKEITTGLFVEKNMILVPAYFYETAGPDFIQAIGKVTVLHMPHSEWAELPELFPEMKEVQKKLDKTRDIAEKKYKELLQTPVKQRYRYFTKNYPELENKIKQDYVASFMGIDRTTFYRHRKVRKESHGKE
jgi:CRP-like cAMP-binding protein